MRHRVSALSGTTLIEVMLALLILLMIHPILIDALSLIARNQYAWDLRQNQIGILQLRRKISTGVNLILTENALSFDFDNQHISMICTQNGLFQQPGNMPYLIGLQSCAWMKRGRYAVILFSMENYHQELIVGIME